MLSSHRPQQPLRLLLNKIHLPKIEDEKGCYINKDQGSCVVNVLLKEKEITDNEGIDLLMKMIAYNPQKRISASEALKHPYLKHPYLDET